MRRAAVLLVSMLCGLAACDRGGSKPDAARLKPAPPLPQLPIEPVPGADGTLAVVSARPTGSATEDVRPAITFSKPMVALEAARAGEAPLPASIEPAVAGRWRWIGSTVAEFVPERSLPLATGFRITVPAGLVAVDGSRLETPFRWEFETQRPRLEAASPEAGHRWLSPRPRLTLQFDQAVRALPDRARFVLADGTAVRIRVVEEVALADLEDPEQPERRRPWWGELPDRRTRYAIEPVSPLPLASAVSLVLDAELASREGPLTLGEGERLEYRTAGPMRLEAAQSCEAREEEAACPEGPLVLFASNPIDLASLEGRLRLDPPVDLDWSRASAVEAQRGVKLPFVRLPGRFRPGTKYRVSIAAGVTDVLGQAAPAFEATVRTVDLPPELQVPSDPALLEAEGDGALPVETINLAKVAARIWPLTPGEAARLLAERWRGEERLRPDGTPIVRSLDVSGERNVRRTTPLPLREALGRRSGLFHVEFLPPGPEGVPGRRLTGQMTDLAVHTKLGSTSGVAWVTSLAAGTPVAGARVSLYDRHGARRWRGQTDGDGLVRIPGLTELLGDTDLGRWPPFALVAAEKGSVVGIARSTAYGEPPADAYDLPVAWEGSRPVSLGTVFTERGIYRPGDRVHVKGLFRFRRLGELAAPPAGTRVTIEVRNGLDDVDVFREALPLTAFGTFSTEFPIPADARLGRYAIRARLEVEGGELLEVGFFRVEEYRTPQFRVDLSAPGAALAGEPLAATVRASYLHGGVMADAAVRWEVLREPGEFEPPGQSGFVFGQWVGLPGEKSKGGREAVACGEAPTDARGAAEVAPGPAEAPDGRPHVYTVEAEVTDVNRQGVGDRRRVTVHPASYYTGLRVGDRGFAAAGRPVPIEVIAVTPEGVRQAGKEVTVEVRRREWRSTRKQDGGGRRPADEVAETRIGGCELRTTTDAVACMVTPDEPGFYVAEAVGADTGGRKAVTRTWFYVVGRGRAAWQGTGAEQLELVSDRQRYQVGETARVLVKNPYPEAEALVTVEREGVRSARRTKLVGSAATVEVPIEEWMVPNAFVSVVLARGRVEGDEAIERGEDPGRPAVRLGYAELAVDARGKRLGVEVTPDASSKRPGEKLTVDVRVRDATGKGRRAEVTLWAVDEGVLRLTGYAPPDLVESLHPPRGLSVRNGEPLRWLVSRQPFGDQERRGPGTGRRGRGGGLSMGAPARTKDDAADPVPRTQFKTTILFAPELVTDASGRVRVEVELPDNLTTYRLLAMAVTEGEEAGTGGAEVTVAKPLLLQPALPRVARVGDSFEAGVVVHARGLSGTGTVRVAAEGLSLDGPSERQVSLDSGPEELRFRFRAEREGTARLVFTASGAGERDAAEFTFPVTLPVGLEAVAAYGEASDRHVEAIVPPGGARPGAGGLELTLASTALVGLDGGMRQLVQYPYGCLEQLSSRLVPFVALRELSETFGVPWQAPEGRGLARALLGEEALARPGDGEVDPDRVVERTVAAIAARQGRDGGFRYWPSDDCPSPYASAYAVLALGRAREVGYRVDAEVLSRGQSYLAETVAAGRPSACRRASGPDDVSRVFALWALARTGAPRSAYYGELAGRREELPLFARALLADAMFVGGGDRAEARQLLDEVLSHARESAADVYLEETEPRRYAEVWSSDARTTAIVLLTLTDVDPTHPFVPKLARWLAGNRRSNGEYRNTQEAAFALMALAEVVRTREREVPDFTARVSLGDRVVAERKFAGRSLQVERVEVPLEAIGSGGHLVFAKEGRGSLQYRALLRYLPAELPLDAADRGLLVQRWFEPYAGGGQARWFKAGELVRVRLRVATSQERRFVAVDVPLPAGLEVVDETLASTAAPPRSAEDQEEELRAKDIFIFSLKRADSRAERSPRFWSPFHHVERRDDRVSLFADRLPPGVHAVSFVARATTPGDFLLPPASAHEMYAPEVNGRSEGGRLRVTMEGAVAER